MLLLRQQVLRFTLHGSYSLTGSRHSRGKSSSSVYSPFSVSLLVFSTPICGSVGVSVDCCCCIGEAMSGDEAADLLGGGCTVVLSFASPATVAVVTGMAVDVVVVVRGTVRERKTGCGRATAATALVAGAVAAVARAPADPSPLPAGVSNAGFTGATVLPLCRALPSAAVFTDKVLRERCVPLPWSCAGAETSRRIVGMGCIASAE